MLAREIGGLSDGNVQLAIAIISDVTTPATRAKGLASIGIAFAVCFCIGPPLGAWFATCFHTPSARLIQGLELNVYAVPAFITLVLLVIETVYIYVALPETRGIKQTIQESKTNEAKEVSPRRASTMQRRLQLLQKLRQTHFMFLATFSGVEFTLTFLTFDLFDWNNIQNGRLLGFIGILSTILQGGYVRRKMAKVGEDVMSRRGIASCACGLVFLTLLPQFATSNRGLAIKMMYAAAACLAFTSATVVNALTSYASLQCDEDGSEKNKQLAKGRALGEFRSSGQLGRAIGPIAACAMYWTVGPSTTYAISAALQIALVTSMRSLAAS
jgi:predicted MFS family arabinose efflux permease